MKLRLVLSTPETPAVRVREYDIPEETETLEVEVMSDVRVQVFQPGKVTAILGINGP